MNTKKALGIMLAIALVLGAYGIAHASDTAQQTVKIEVAEINEISINGDAITLALNAVEAGFLPEPDMDTSTTYAITTNGTNKKITAKLDSAMPSDLDLKVFLNAPTGATGGGGSLTTSELDVVTGISSVVASGITIRYELYPAGTIPPAPISETKTVIFTLTDQ